MKKNILIALGVILSLILVFSMVLINDKNIEEKKPQTEESKPKKSEKPKRLKIMDINSKTRPIGVMVNNHKVAQPNQTGLNKAYLIYEIVVEGGITRMFALFKDVDTNIGTVRSARHYFIDYALENDAMYTHFGGSPQGLDAINKYHINNISGMVDDRGFWRNKELLNKNVPLEHTAFTSIERIKDVAKYRGYRTTTDNKNLLKYSIDEIDLSQKEGAILADEVFIDYSSYQKNTFKYDKEKKIYNKYSGNELRVDYETKEPFEAKNIITYQVANYNIGDGSARQEIDNLGKGKGYFISNGYAVPITWEKKTESSQTVYKYLDGEEIVVNDGITYIQIQPKNRKLEFKEKID